MSIKLNTFQYRFENLVGDLQAIPIDTSKVNKS
jgi:hypothetical protein